MSDSITPGEKISSLAGVVAGVIADPLNAIATKEIIDKRTTICEACPYRRGRKCVVCTCNLYVKVRVNPATCPKGKW